GLAKLNAIKNRSSRWHVANGRCLQGLKQYDNAIKAYQQSPDWRKHAGTLISIARCYDEMGDIANAVKTCQTVENWQKDRLALLGLARCHQERKKICTRYQVLSIRSKSQSRYRDHDEPCSL